MAGGSNKNDEDIHHPLKSHQHQQSQPSTYMQANMQQPIMPKHQTEMQDVLTPGYHPYEHHVMASMGEAFLISEALPVELLLAAAINDDPTSPEQQARKQRSSKSGLKRLRRS